MAQQQVVQTLLVELDGKTIELEAKLAAMEKRVEQFNTKASAGSQETGRVAGSIGDRYATAARQIAFAGEQAARTGKLAGEAGRQILSQGANMALMFGAKGAIAGGVAIVGLAIVELFQRTRREMQETKAQAVKDLEDLARGNDLAAIARRQQYARSGDPYARRGSLPGETNAAYIARSGGLMGVQARIDEIDRGVTPTEAEAIALAQLPPGAFADLLKKEREQLVKERDKLQKTIKETGPILDRAVADAVYRTDQEIRGGADKRGAKKIAEDAREAALLREQVLDVVAASSRSAAEVSEQALLKQVAALKAAIAANDAMTASTKKGLTAKLDDAAATELQTIEVQRLTEQLDDVLRIADARGPSQGTFNALNAQQLKLLELQRQFKGNKAAERQISEALLKIDEMRARLVKAMASNGDDVVKTERERVKNMREFVQALGAGIQGAAELAAALGLGSRELAAMAGGIGAIVGSLPGEGQKWGRSNLLGLAGGTASIVASIVSLLGDSPEEQERRRMLEENTNAIQELTRKAGLIGAGLAVSGGGISGSGATLSDFIARRIAFDEMVQRELANLPAGLKRKRQEELAGLRPELTADEKYSLETIAKRLGVTLDGSIESFIQLQHAIDAASGKLAEFTTDFDGVNAWLEFERQIFGDQGPLDNLGKLLSQFGGMGTKTLQVGGRTITLPSANSSAHSPAIAEILKAGDPNTPEGRAAMRRIIEGYADMMRAGGATITDEMLGGLSGAEFQQLLAQIIGYLNEIEGGSNTGTGGYNISRTITEVTGDRIAALLLSANAFQERTALAVEALQAGLVGPITAPAVAGIGGGPTLHIENWDLIIEVPFGVSAADAGGIGSAVAIAVEDVLRKLLRDLGDGDSDVIAKIDRALGVRFRSKRRARGDNTL